MDSQVTTKRGDQGCTTALSGDSCPKSHPIMECVGALDELRAHTALVRLMILEKKPEHWERLGDSLFWLLHAYFLAGSACSDPTRKHPEYRKGDIAQTHIERLEAEQRWIEERTPLRKSFVVSASNTLAAETDITSAVARRFERNLVRLKETVPDFDAADLLAFFNRLSDFLFMLARSLEGPNHTVVDYDILIGQ